MQRVLLLLLAFKTVPFVAGRVAQRIRRLTTNQEIPGSNPGVIEFLVFGIGLHGK